LLEWNPQIVPQHVALVCHPHPLYGGTLHNKVVFRAAKAALELGLPTLRFNFRGAGKSAGTFASGIGEREDVRGALDYLSARFPGLPVCLMGFSFGSWVGLAVGATDQRVSALVGLGVPASSNDFTFLREVRKPKLIIQGTRDEFGPRTQLEVLYNSLANPKQLHWVHDADHFFTGKLAVVQKVLRDFLSTLVGQGRAASEGSWQRGIPRVD
jgi:alpha/beta superfamily hydrolase